jgi:hypothetical protein
MIVMHKDITASFSNVKKLHFGIFFPLCHFDCMSEISCVICREPVWLSTAPTETLTHWYQVRCLVETPVLVKQGQTLNGKCVLRCNKR